MDERFKKILKNGREGVVVPVDEEVKLVHFGYCDYGTKRISIVGLEDVRECELSTNKGKMSDKEIWNRAFEMFIYAVVVLSTAFYFYIIICKFNGWF